jgi:hypothetical protein
VFQNKALRRIFGLKRDEVTGENCIMKSFIGQAYNTKGGGEECI